MIEDPLLTPVDVARRCQVSTKTVLRAIHAGRLRASRLGSRGAYRVRVEDVLAWLEDTSTIGPLPSSAAPAVDRPSMPDRTPDPAGRLVVRDGMGRQR